MDKEKKRRLSGKIYKKQRELLVRAGHTLPDGIENWDDLSAQEVDNCRCIMHKQVWEKFLDEGGIEEVNASLEGFAKEANEAIADDKAERLARQMLGEDDDTPDDLGGNGMVH